MFLLGHFVTNAGRQVQTRQRGWRVERGEREREREREIVLKWLRSVDSSEVRSRDNVSECSDDAGQSTEHKEPERDVLCKLEQNHTTVDVRARTLAYCPRLLKHAPKVLRVVAITTQKNGWYIDRLADLGNAQLTPHAWASCMREHLWMMKRLADGFLYSPRQSVTRHEPHDPFYEVLLVWDMW